ncbi:hypothetical protein MTO96_017089 [Rhipicephalus appendiculatus]
MDSAVERRDEQSGKALLQTWQPAVFADGSGSPEPVSRTGRRCVGKALEEAADRRPDEALCTATSHDLAHELGEAGVGVQYTHRPEQNVVELLGRTHGAGTVMLAGMPSTIGWTISGSPGIADRVQRRRQPLQWQRRTWSSVLVVVAAGPETGAAAAMRINTVKSSIEGPKKQRPARQVLRATIFRRREAGVTNRGGSSPMATWMWTIRLLRLLATESNARTSV